MHPKILFAPLQGFTHCYYRNAHHQVIGGIKAYYSPYIRLDNNKQLAAKYIKDLDPKHNTAPVVPQLLVNNSVDTIRLCLLLQDWGYQEVNLNFACPYKMVSNRLLGSGMLTHPEKILNLLEDTLSKIQMRLSLKLRLGLDVPEAIYALLPLLNHLPLSHIIIHPRTAHQLYKGQADVNAFLTCQQYSNHKLIYNGDIKTPGQALQLASNMTDTLMIGRGLLNHIFLAQEISSKNYTETEKLELLRCFHDEIYLSLRSTSANFPDTHGKLLSFWSYFSNHWSQAHKIVKKIKKTREEKDYLDLVSHLYNEGLQTTIVG